MSEPKKKIDLRSRPAAPAAPDPALAAAVQATHRFPAGTAVVARRDQSLADAIASPSATTTPTPLLAAAVSATRTTPSGAAVLRQIGWVEGQPIPAEVADELAAVVKAAPEGTPPEVAVARLDPFTKQALKDKLDAAALAAASGAVASEVSAVEATVAMMEAAPPVDKREDRPEKSPTGLESHVCRRCGFDADGPAPDEPTDEDRQHYLLYVQGHVDRFVKTVALYGGSVQVRFRSLTVAELSAIRAQMAADVNAERIRSTSEYILENDRYRMVASTEAVRRGDIWKDMPSILDTDAFEFDTVAGRPVVDLAKIRDWYFAELVPAEALARSCFAAFGQFIRLMEDMDARATNANFWQGIA